MKVKVTKNGPYLVSGSVPLRVESIDADAQGDSIAWKETRTFEAREKYALCRCGESQTKPYCDGTHAKIGFDGTETASKAPFEALAERLEGPTLVLHDAESLCAFARFCDVAGSVWKLVGESDDRQSRILAIREAERCPSGRLVMHDARSGTAFEPVLEKSIGLIEDPVKECSGPIWVRGGIEVVAEDGTSYPSRNRQTLCRCGQSQNKPFCDGTHAESGFADGL